MNIEKKPEVLAPAGTLDAIENIFEAGADAVYIGGKSFNMRQHRSSYNLTDKQIGQAVELAHSLGRRLYYTMNSLVFDGQMDLVRDTLSMVGDIGPDALIVQDLGIASLAREICVHVPLHASTMMNVHNAETAASLKMMGFVRIIPSRDIPLTAVRRIAEQSGLEMECFVHGDMCISQSAQCYLSAIALGESANCGRCMKPCRWNWQLKASKDDTDLGEQSQGYLLARKDMCMLPHIPALVQNDVRALKIEGRMRTAEFIAPVAALYRKAVDAYFDDPAAYLNNAADMQNMYSQRVRKLTTAHSFANPAGEGIDISGKREPRFFSHAGPTQNLTVGHDSPVDGPMASPELIVHVSNVASAKAAVEAGTDAVYFCSEGYPIHGPIPTTDTLLDFCRSNSKNHVRIAVIMPHICDERDIAEWKPRLAALAPLPDLTVGVSSLGGLQAARDARCRDILADYPLNVTNTVAADELSTAGASRITAAVELTFEKLAELTETGRMPIEIIGQGPVCGMLLEHCVIASAAGESPQGLCSMRCRRDTYRLQDTASQAYPLECDRRCRNHVFTAADVCVLPNLARISSLDISALRIECQLDNAKTVAVVTRVYRQALDNLKAGQSINADEGVELIAAAVNRPLSDGPFDFRSVAASVKENELAPR